MLANLTKTTHRRFIFLTPPSETRNAAASSRLCSSTTSNVSDLSGSKKKKKKAAKCHHRSGSAQGGGGGTSAAWLKVPISAEPADVNIVRAAGLSGGNIGCYRTVCKTLSNWAERKTQKNEQDKRLLNPLKGGGWGKQGHQRSRCIFIFIG